MPKASSKKKRKRSEDTVQAAARSMQAFAERTEREPEPEITDEMRAAAAAFGRIGGRIGGKKRARALTPERRREIAKAAAEKRWAKKR